MSSLTEIFYNKHMNLNITLITLTRLHMPMMPPRFEEIRKRTIAFIIDCWVYWHGLPTCIASEETRTSDGSFANERIFSNESFQTDLFERIFSNESFRWTKWTGSPPSNDSFIWLFCCAPIKQRGEDQDFPNGTSRKNSFV